MSSSGHLVLFGAWLGIAEEGILFEVAVHAATLLAVVVFYRDRVSSLAVGALRGEADAWRYGLKLGVATLPAVGSVLLAREFFEGLYERVAPIGLALWVSGALVYSTRFTLDRSGSHEPTWSDALWIGFAQAAAIVPGVSRSGSTVATALWRGVAPAAAAEFSFLMSIVSITGAVVLQIPNLGAVSAEGWTTLGLGAGVALVSGLAALWLFVRLLASQVFHRFAWYLWPLGDAVLVWAQLR